MESFIVDSGGVMFVGDLAFRHGLTEQNTKDNGQTGKLTGKVFSIKSRQIHTR
jgi:glyoxylase-like metal-dependent hydrolase (beta-lactamase superfamily II)